MSTVSVKIEDLSKLYRLGEVGTGAEMIVERECMQCKQAQYNTETVTHTMSRR